MRARRAASFLREGACGARLRKAWLNCEYALAFDRCSSKGCAKGALPEWRTAGSVGFRRWRDDRRRSSMRTLRLPSGSNVLFRALSRRLVGGRRRAIHEGAGGSKAPADLGGGTAKRLARASGRHADSTLFGRCCRFKGAPMPRMLERFEGPPVDPLLQWRDDAFREGSAAGGVGPKPRVGFASASVSETFRGRAARACRAPSSCVLSETTSQAQASSSAVEVIGWCRSCRSCFRNRGTSPS